MAIIQTAIGLIFADDMNRASGDPIDNGWAEAESTPSTLVISSQSGSQVARNTRNVDSTSQRYTRLLPAGVANMIFQSNLEHQNGSTGAITLAARSAPPVTQASVIGIFAQWTNPAGGTFQVGGGGAVFCTAVGVTAGLNGDALRLTIEDVGGGNLRCTGYLTNLIAGPGYLRDLSQVPVQQTQCTFASAALATDAYGMAHARLGNSKMWFCCAENIVMTGLPVGWGINLDGGPNTFEVAGTATIDAKPLVLPYTVINVVNGGGIFQEAFTPVTPVPTQFPAAGFGGDEFAFTSGPTPPTPVAARTLSRFIAGTAIFPRTLTPNRAARLISGAGDPEGVHDAPVGSAFFRVDGGPWVYTKETGGTGPTGWVAKIL